LKVEPSMLAGKATHDIVYAADVDDTRVTQNYAYSESGFWLTFLVITIAEPFRPQCEPGIEKIRADVVLPE
jgi:hypothetical protein